MSVNRQQQSPFIYSWIKKKGLVRKTQR